MMKFKGFDGLNKAEEQELRNQLIKDRSKKITGSNR